MRGRSKATTTRAEKQMYGGTGYRYKVWAREQINPTEHRFVGTDDEMGIGCMNKGKTAPKVEGVDREGHKVVTGHHTRRDG